MQVYLIQANGKGTPNDAGVPHSNTASTEDRVPPAPGGGYRIDCPVFAQSSTKAARPLSVSGCL